MKVWKRRLFTLVAGLALAMVLASSGAMIADTLGMSITPQVHACGVSSGGGC